MDLDKVALGGIWYVDLPQLPGHEQGGRRPAVVLQDMAYAGDSPLVLAATLTSQMAATRFPGTLVVEQTSGNGLRAPSVVMLFQMRAIDRSRFLHKLGELSLVDMTRVFETLDKLIGRRKFFESEDDPDMPTLIG